MQGCRVCFGVAVTGFTILSDVHNELLVVPA